MEERTLEFYFRFRKDYEKMDLFAAKLQTAAAQALVANDFSKLFTHIGIVPREPDENGSLPQSLIDIDPVLISRRLLWGSSFRYSMRSNRFIPTHSGNESVLTQSIPILGTTVVGNEAKRGKGPYVHYPVVFDTIDVNLKQTSDDIATKAYTDASRLNAGASMVTIIEEFLKALIEVETLELARVKKTEQTG